MKISIISINLNNALGLEKTISSVINQNFKDFEYIVIDGGSTDKSIDIIKENANKIDNWVSEKDTGIYNAMNKGIMKSKGEYILFLNSGDYLINSDILNNIFSKEYNEDILYGDITFYNPNKKTQMTTCVPDTLDLHFFYKQSLWHQAAFIRSKLFKTLGFYNENNRFVSDWEFFMNAIAFKQATYKKLDFIITYYNMYNGLTLRYIDESNEEKKLIINRIFNPTEIILLEKLDNVKKELESVFQSETYKISKSLYKIPILFKFLQFIIKVLNFFKKQ